MTSFLVQSGIFSDRSKEIRIEAQKIVNKENLNSKKIEIITSGLKNETDTKKIIKLAIFMPRIGNGLNNIKDLRINQYAWVSISDNYLIEKDKYKIIYDSNNLYPWKLIKKNNK